MGTMIHVDPRAQTYFRNLLERQGEGILGIHVSVSNAGTPAADVALRYCEPSDLKGDEWQLEVSQGLSLYVDADSAPYLDQAEIALKNDGTSEQLSIRAPGLRGQVPSAEAGLVERIRWLIDSEINPQLASHGGHVDLEEVTAEGEVVLRFGGGCHGCGMAHVTLREGIERRLREAFPEITSVRDATDHATGEQPYYR